MTYTEDALVEQPAIKFFDAPVWDTLNCWNETFQINWCQSTILSNIQNG